MSTTTPSTPKKEPSKKKAHKKTGEPIISIKNVRKDFELKHRVVKVVKEVNLDVHPGEYVILLGQSGAGKSTLLHTMVGLEPPTAGTITIAGEDITSMTQDEIAQFRLRNVGIIYQRPDWIRSLTVLENVAFPLAISGVPLAERTERAYALLEKFGVGNRAQFVPTELSGGEQQRVEIARAIITKPKVLICDEPTGNLDTESSAVVMEAFRELNEKEGYTIVMITHNHLYTDYADTVIMMEDGEIVSNYSKSEGTIE